MNEIMNRNYNCDVDENDLDAELKDYDDEILHGLSEKMSKLSRKHNKRLLEVLRYSQDPDERSKAATLLSWSITPENILYILDFNQ